MQGLHYQKLLNGPRNIIVLHGLFGSSRNWTSIGNHLHQKFTVYLVDQRNHGDSFHSPTHQMIDLVEDLYDFIEEHNIHDPIILGHSMGGFCAMQFALKYSDKLNGLVVVDIAPKQYASHHSKEIAALEMDVSQFDSRQAIEQAMKLHHPSQDVRRFLMMNLKKSDGGYSWKINVQAIKNSNTLETGFPAGQFNKKCLFVRGELSTYMSDQDELIINKFFPGAIIETIVGAGHWLHHSHQARFLELLDNFLSE